MFHVNAWGMPYAGAMSGARLVMPGPALDGRSVYELMRDERVTLALGVPTVWLMLQQYVEAAGLQPLQDLCLRRVVIGGSAAPRAMSERFATQFGAFSRPRLGNDRDVAAGQRLPTSCRGTPVSRPSSAWHCRRSRARRSMASR
jgi:acyl-CoA synthetase (AMP-forming)/AMP-acid ligase II